MIGITSHKSECVRHKRTNTQLFFACLLWPALFLVQTSFADETNTPTTEPAAMAWIQVSSDVESGKGSGTLRLEGFAIKGQKVELVQNGVVFYEQRLSQGEFRVTDIQPLQKAYSVNVRWITPHSKDLTLAIASDKSEQKKMSINPIDIMAPTPLNSETTWQPKDSAGTDEELEFEMDFLRGRAFRSMDSKSLQKLGQTRPGKIDVNVYRNNAPVTNTNLLFTEPVAGGEARPCLNSQLFMQLGVKPDAISAAGQQLLEQGKLEPQPKTGPLSAADKACLYMEDWVVDATAKYNPGELRVDLSIPQAFLAKDATWAVPPGMLTRGENAGFINYNLNHYATQGENSNFLYLNSGFNIQGWQVRQSSYLSRSSNGLGMTAQQYGAGQLFVSRPLIDWKSKLSAGEINSQSPIIGAVPMLGIQLASEEGLMSMEERFYRPKVRGVARTNALVQVSQNGAVFFEQTMPPGPFELTDLNPPSAVGNLTVQIKEADGRMETFAVPYTQTAGKLNPGSSIYSLSVGKYRTNSAQVAIPVVQASLRYGLNNHVTPSLELLVASNYVSAGLEMAFNSTWGSTGVRRTQSQGRGVGTIQASGSLTSVNYSAPAWGPLQFYGGFNHQSLGYVAPISALTTANLDPYSLDNLKTSAYASLGIGFERMGSVGVSVVNQNTWANNQYNYQYQLNYGTNVGKVSLSAYLSKSTNANGSPDIQSIGLSASVPLDMFGSPVSVRAGYNQYGSSPATQSISASGGFLEDHHANYNLTRTQNGSVGYSSASLGYQHPWGSLGASLSASNANASLQAGLSANGGLVLHQGGLILAPTLGHTFAIVEVPKGEGAGVMGSRARINSAGYGVVPYLSPYFLNDVQVTLEGASPDLEVDNASQKIAPVEGSIVRLKFNATSGRPLLLQLTASNGARIPIGATVTDSKGNEVGTVGQGGRALVRVQTSKDTLSVQWGDEAGETCQTTYQLDDKLVANVSGFISLKLRCDTGADLKTAEGNPK